MTQATHLCAPAAALDCVVFVIGGGPAGSTIAALPGETITVEVR